MCSPDLAILAITVASSAAQYDNARRSGNIQADNIRADNERAQQALVRRQDQQAAAAAAEMNDANRRAAKDMALFDVVAGEYGGGASSDRARAVASIQRDEGLATVGSNLLTGQAEAAFRGVDIAAQTGQRVASIDRPSLFGTALQIGGAALKTYSNSTALEAAKKPPTRST